MLNWNLLFIISIFCFVSLRECWAVQRHEVFTMSHHITNLFIVIDVSIFFFFNKCKNSFVLAHMHRLISTATKCFQFGRLSHSLSPSLFFAQSVLAHATDWYRWNSDEIPRIFFFVSRTKYSRRMRSQGYATFSQKLFHWQNNCIQSVAFRFFWWLHY